MNARDILFRTNRFNLSVTKPHFINPDSFGEDLAAWLRSKLIEKGVEVPHSGQEDWGWYLKAKKGKDSYLLGMNGIPDETGQDKTDLGEWRIIVKKNRSAGQWLRGRGKIDADDAMLIMIEDILGKEADFSEVHQEESGRLVGRA
jgi:hypothetical protein